MNLSVEHIGLAARDTVALKEWYTRALDAREVFTDGKTPPAFMLDLGGGPLIEVYPAESSRTEAGNNKLAGWRHVAVRVASIEAARQDLADRGVVFEESIKPAGGGGRVLFFRDGEGNLLHLVERASGTDAGTPGLGRRGSTRAMNFRSKWKSTSSAATMNPSKAVIFDMDGVIVDSEPLHERAFHEVLDEIGFGANHGIDFPAYYGKSDLVVWRDFVEHHRPPQPLEELLSRKEAKFTALVRREEPIFDGLPELLEKAAAQFPLALASGSRHPTIDAVLALRDLRRFSGRS